ncbi:MAG: VanW family protein [Caldilineales bacterium]|nr:VanW family protein [Caldilineales bacterium]
MAQAVTSVPLSRRTSRSSNLGLLFLIWLLVPVLILVFALAQFELTYAGRVYPGVQALGIDLSGMSEEQAQTALEAAANTYDLPPLALRHGDQVWPLKREELGVEVDTNQLAIQALAVGRSGEPVDNLFSQWQAFWRGKRLSPQLVVQPGSVTQAIVKRTAGLNHNVTEPRLTLSDLQVVVSASRPGQIVDVAATQAAVMERLEHGGGGVVPVVVRELSAAEADVDEAQSAIRELLQQPLVLADSRGDFQFALDPATLAALLVTATDENAPGGIRIEFKQDALRAMVEDWASQIQRPPLDARFDFDAKTGTLIELSPSAEGYALDVDQTVAAITAALSAGDRHLGLPIQVIQPAVSSQDAASLGIKELVARGSSSFAGSSADRIKNIEVAASKFVGVVIPPGEVFSFVDHVGDVTAANGFEDSLVIAGDTTAVGVGGGVCQVSTTVFRTAWFGGFPIEERWNHGYVVSWYGKPGLDATIYTPTVDFKFRNTTEHHLLIKPVIDSAKGVLTFDFYGTKPNWTVETEEPQYTNRQSPPPPLYVEDPGLPAGRVVQFDWSVEGMDASVKRVVKDAAGTVLINQTLNSKYRPWQAKFRYGPGFTPPAGAEVQRVSQ